MNILMILDGEFPPDERVEKEALTLLSEGNRVFILCLNYGNFKLSENYKGIEIIRIGINKPLRNKMQATYLILPFYRMLWKRKIESVIKEETINVIHIHDLPLADIGIRIRRKYNLKVVCDQHEFYSVWIVRTAHYNTFTGRIVRILSNWEKYERKYLALADLVITVAEPLRETYIKERGVKREKIIVLPNTPSREVFNDNNIDRSVVEKYRDNFMLFYAGHIDILRGINTIIEALPLIRETIPDFKFVLAGRFNRKYYDPIRFADELGVLDMIEYLEWIPLQKLPSYVAASKVCIFIPPNTPEMNSTIVTKVYQNIVMHKPMIVGQPELMKNLVEKNGIGLSIKESNPNDLAEKLIMLWATPELLKSFEENARLIAEDYYWEVTSAPLSDQYGKLKEELSSGIHD
ncbi:MAG: glycosyltransferase [Bacteroidales bacterium]|jgi:glycosyltransferase involved in cell wall biosynthesis|nr:glycosyltransferase [Bacteroidales bacterium]